MEQADETLGGEGESGDLSLRLFKEKANAKGPIYACYNFAQSLPHVLNTFFFQVPKRTPHKIKLEEWEQKQKKMYLTVIFLHRNCYCRFLLQVKYLILESASLFRLHCFS